jgi:hypothetical protein
MLKEVGASGQISLGKKYAGQLFEVETQIDGGILMRPMKVVPATLGVQESVASYGQASTAPKETTRAWVQAHAADIDRYNAWASLREPYSQRCPALACSNRWRALTSTEPDWGGSFGLTVCDGNPE